MIFTVAANRALQLSCHGCILYRSVILTFRAAAGVEPLSAAWSFEEYMSLRFIFKQHVSGGLVVQSHWEHVRLKVLPPVRVDGREGGQVVLTCSATGSPAPSIAWYKVGNPPHPPTVQITRLVRDPNYKKNWILWSAHVTALWPFFLLSCYILCK